MSSAAVFAFSCATALHVASAVEAVPSQDVTLTLTSERSSYYVGEPVRLTLVVANHTDALVEGRFQLFDYQESVSTLYRRLGGEFNEVPRRWNGLSDRSIHPMRIAPGAEGPSKKTLFLNWATNRLLMETPGEYEFQVAARPFRDSDLVFRSDVLQIRVEESPGEHAEAFGEYTSGNLHLFVGGLISPKDREASARAIAFLDHHPTSPYTAVVRAALFKVVETRVLNNFAEDADRTLYEQMKRDRASTRSPRP